MVKYLAHEKTVLRTTFSFFYATKVQPFAKVRTLIIAAKGLSSKTEWMG